jgi:hypothetical protein
VSLVRNEEQAKIVGAAFPNVETVVGDLDDSALLEAEAAKADVVLSTCAAYAHHHF